MPRGVPGFETYLPLTAAFSECRPCEAAAMRTGALSLTRNPTSHSVPKRTKSRVSKEVFAHCVHSSITHNRQKVETTQMSISG